jgi:hypothetical protein
MITKEKKIETALSKLTTEEKELLGLVKKEVKPKIKKNYKLKIEYMIGDSDGYTNEKATININNPFVILITEALDKLKIPEGSWGLVLNEEDYVDNYKNNNISELEFDLLCLVSNYSYNKDNANKFFKKHNFKDTNENHDYLQEFDGLLIDETEYSFLVYEGYTLK